MTADTIMKRYTGEDILRFEREKQIMTIENPPESEPLGKDFWASAKKKVRSDVFPSINLDNDVYAWFKSKENSHVMMNQVLRDYISNHQ